MIRVIEVEFYKFIRRKSFIISLILFAIIFVASIILLMYRGVSSMDTKNYINEKKKQINLLEEQKNVGGNNKKKGNEKIINDLKLEVKNLEMMQDESITWQERVKVDIIFCIHRTNSTIHK